MNIAQKIELPKWLVSDALTRIMGVVDGMPTKNQGMPKSLIVGGAVRNALMGVGPTDIDITTEYTPQEITQKCEAQNMKVIPTGIDHGTVTVVIDKIHFEVTTLRKDVETDGRHAVVAYTDNWAEDARRRDFTMNTLLMDMDGNIYDPISVGLKDIKAHHIAFVGVPAQRIEEDVLRILRFFRFHAQYGRGEMDAEALAACTKAADKIATLSRERVTQEFMKILAVRDPTDVLKIMQDSNILPQVFDKNYQSDILHRLCYFQDEFQAPHLVSRLFVLAGMTPRLFDGVLLLSHIQKKFMIKLQLATTPHLYANEKAMKKAIFYHGHDLLRQGYLLRCAKTGQPVEAGMMDILENWDVPDCPITGQSLLEAGYKTGPELGQELDRLKKEWLDRVIDGTP